MYVPRTKYVPLLFSTVIQPSLTLNAGASTQTIAALTLPSDLKGTIIGMHAELRICTVEDDSAAANGLNGVQSCQMDIDGAGYDTVINLTGNLNVLANGVNAGSIFTGSYIDSSALTGTLDKGSVLTFQWLNSKSVGANLYLYDMQVILHLLVRF